MLNSDVGTDRLLTFPLFLYLWLLTKIVKYFYKLPFLKYWLVMLTYSGTIKAGNLEGI